MQVSNLVLYAQSTITVISGQSEKKLEAERTKKAEIINTEFLAVGETCQAIFSKCSRLKNQKSLSLAGAATSMIFVTTNMCLLWQTCVCHDKTCLLSQQKYACCDKTFAVTNIFLSQEIFVTTNIILSWRKFCRGKHTSLGAQRRGP